jgi:hypothetical protein
MNLASGQQTQEKSENPLEKQGKIYLVATRV